MDKRAPILVVLHDEEDGSWQFLTGEDLTDKKNWLLVALSEVVAVDPTVKDLTDLPLGYSARRVKPGAVWQRRRNPAPEADEG
jgi:hypothetical protein